MWQSSIIFICSGEIVTVDNFALEISDVAKENQGQLSQLFVYTTYQMTLLLLPGDLRDRLQAIGGENICERLSAFPPQLVELFFEALRQQGATESDQT